MELYFKVVKSSFLSPLFKIACFLSCLFQFHYVYYYNNMNILEPQHLVELNQEEKYFTYEFLTFGR